MTTVSLAPPPILQFFNNLGQPNAGGSILTQVGGVNYPTYEDSAGVTALPNPIPLNSRGEISNAAGASKQLFLEGGKVYTFTQYDASHNQINQATYTTAPGSLAQFADPSGAALVGSAAWYGSTITGFNATAVPDGATVIFYGRDAQNDGGGGVFTYNKTSTQAADGGLVFQPTGGGRLFRNGWTVLGFNGRISVQWFGAKCDATTDDTTAINAAMAAVPAGSALTFPGISLTTGVVVTKRLDFIGTSSGGDGSGLTGSGLKSTSNATILNFSTTASRYALVENMNILGLTTAGTGQNGINIGNAGLRMENCTIRACGGAGILVSNSYGSHIRSVYVSLCAGDGVKINGTVGANLWEQVISAGNSGHGWNLNSMDGSDLFLACDGEQNTGRGFYFGNGVKGNRFIHTFSELNTAGTLLFDVGSDNNSVQFNSYSSSAPEPAPVNSGGIGNTVSGLQYGQPTNRWRFGGQLGVGDTGINPAFTLDATATNASAYVGHIGNKSATAPNALFIELSGVTGGTGASFLDCWDNARRMEVLGNGNVQNVNNSYAGLSDVKLKENITPARGYLADLCRVNVVKYSMISDGLAKANQLGVIAQEVEKIFPGLVEETDDVEVVDETDENGESVKRLRSLGTKTKSVKYSVFVPMLLTAVQELNARLEALEKSGA